MAKNTEISWTNRILTNGTIIKGATFNPWWGCFKVSEECKHCYAADIATHYGYKDTWGPASTSTRRFFGDAHWQEPLSWNRQAERAGHRHSVFCASMADVYENNPILIPHRERLWQLIETTPWLNWLILTKRPENILAMSPWHVWPDNIWLGTSVGLQSRAEERIPHLLQVPTAVRFLSCEPLLGQLDLSPWLSEIQWVICGGESGNSARPMNLDWARQLHLQCSEARVPFFFKQVGGRYHNSGGSLLDGQHSRAMPPESPSSPGEQDTEKQLEASPRAIA
jgi:protein gp37